MYWVSSKLGAKPCFFLDTTKPKTSDTTLNNMLQAIKIQYGQRSEPAQTKPIQNKHKHCTSQF